jgi:tetratricopeptide (TPR) repeat protein
MFADIVDQLSRLSFFLAVVLGFTVIMMFKKELRELMGRFSKLEARGVTVEANHPAPSQAPAGLTEVEAPTLPNDSEQEDPRGSLEVSTDPDDAGAVRRAMVEALEEGNRAQGEQLFERLRDLETDPDERKRDDVRRLAGLFSSGLDQTALDEMKRLAKDSAIASFALLTIGESMQRAGMTTEAKIAFAEAIAAAQTPLDHAMAVTRLAETEAILTDPRTAIRSLIAYLESESDPGACSVVWAGLASLYKEVNEALPHAIALHRLAEHSVNDAGMWLEAGYAYGQAGLETTAQLAVHCYLTALRFDQSHSMATNNLGVVVRYAGLPMKGVGYFQKASEKGNTLAMANLGNAYLDGGFLAEAKETLQEAAAARDPHPNVASHLSDLAKRETAEEQNFTALQTESARAADFVVTIAEAWIRSMPQISGVWKVAKTGDEVEVSTVEEEGEPKLRVTWVDSESQSERRFFKGSLSGGCASGPFHRKPNQDPAEWIADGSGFAVVSEDGTSIRMIRLNRASNERWTLTRSEE